MKAMPTINGLIDKLFTIIGFLAMLFASWVLGTRLMDFISTLDNQILQWILYLALFLTTTASIFLVPIIISIKSDNQTLNPFNGVIAIMWLFLAVPLSMILTSFVWELAEDWLGDGGISTTSGGVEGGTVLIIIQLLIISILILWCYLVPIIILLTDEPITRELMGGESL